jgi:hypothetical protein
MSGVFYIGLGEQFAESRLCREPSSTRKPGCLIVQSARLIVLSIPSSNRRTAFGLFYSAFVSIKKTSTED